MAVTISLYDHTTQRFASGANTASDVYKVELLSNAATFDASHTTKTAVDNAGAYEVAGNGWAAGGEALANVAISTVNTNDAKFDADDLSVTATGGDIGPAYKALLYNDTDTNDPPVAFIDFGEAKSAGDGTDFKITWNAAGIVTFTY